MQPIQGISDVFILLKKENPTKAYALTMTDVINVKSTELMVKSNDQRNYNIIEALLTVPQLPKIDSLFLIEDLMPNSLECIIIEHLFKTTMKGVKRDISIKKLYNKY